MGLRWPGPSNCSWAPLRCRRYLNQSCLQTVAANARAHCELTAKLFPANLVGLLIGAVSRVETRARPINGGNDTLTTGVSAHTHAQTRALLSPGVILVRTLGERPTTEIGVRTSHQARPQAGIELAMSRGQETMTKANQKDNQVLLRRPRVIKTLRWDSQ